MLCDWNRIGGPVHHVWVGEWLSELSIKRTRGPMDFLILNRISWTMHVSEGYYYEVLFFLSPKFARLKLHIPRFRNVTPHSPTHSSDSLCTVLCDPKPHDLSRTVRPRCTRFSIGCTNLADIPHSHMHVQCTATQHMFLGVLYSNNSSWVQIDRCMWVERGSAWLTFIRSISTAATACQWPRKILGTGDRGSRPHTINQLWSCHYMVSSI